MTLEDYKPFLDAIEYLLDFHEFEYEVDGMYCDIRIDGKFFDNIYEGRIEKNFVFGVCDKAQAMKENLEHFKRKYD